jgi:transposase
MKKSNKFSSEVRKHAVLLVQEHRGDDPSLWAIGLFAIKK